MPHGKMVKLLGRWRKDFNPGERVSAGAVSGEFNGYVYGDEWTTALILPDGGGDEVAVPLNIVNVAVRE
jgi:hypothetical protein